MTSFDLHEPRSLREAFALLERHGEGAHLLAGGTALLLLIRSGLLLPDHIISLQRIGGLREIGISPDGGLEIGALVTHREIERSALVQRFFEPLAQTFGRVATVRIRNQGTLGGNLVHADPAGDPPPMLMALDARIVMASNAGPRTVPVCEFFTGLFETPLRARRAEAALLGSKPTRELLASSAALVMEEIDPLDDLRGSAAYKREMARVWTRRALAALTAA